MGGSERLQGGAEWELCWSLFHLLYNDNEASDLQMKMIWMLAKTKYSEH